jgi:capsular exopolysaccharide synthesis family protein
MPKPTRSPQVPQNQFHVSDYLRMLYRRRWICGLTLLLVFMYGAFSTLKTTPIYEATTQVLVDKGASRATSLDSVLSSNNAYYDNEDFYSTQLRIMQSRALAARAVHALGLKAGTPALRAADPGLLGGLSAWVHQVVGAPKRIDPPAPDESTAEAALVGGFLGGLSVAQARGTRIVELQYRSADPVFAAKAANELAQQYIQQTLQSRIDATQETSDYLQDQLTEYKQRVAASERALQEYNERNNSVGIDDGQGVISQDHAELTAKLTSAKIDRIQKESVYRTVVSLQASDPAKLETLPDVMANSFVQDLKTQLLDLRQVRATLLTRYLDRAPQMLEIDGKIQNAEAKLSVEIGKVVQSIENQYETAKATEAQIQAAVNTQNASAQRLNRKSAEYISLKDDADSNRVMLNTLLERAKETGVSNEYRGTNIKIVDRAEVPRSPVLPNTRRDLLMALLAGCALAAGVAFGFEYLDSRIRTPEEIKTRLGLPFLGLVPAIAEKDVEGKSPLISGTVPPAFAEAMRGLRTAVVFSSADEGARTIVVTSTAPSEGKTVISSNLAVALAQAEQRTLIVDGDMRRPRVHEVFDRLQEPGLSNVLVGTSELHSAICRTSITNLFVLSAGHIPPNPAELLGSSKYRELIQDLRHQFDWIIVDAPPVMAVTDAAVVANGATGVVFVVGAEMTSWRHAAFAIEQLTAVKAHFIGAVLNRADVQRHAYYYSTYYRKDYTQAYTRTP